MATKDAVTESSFEKPLPPSEYVEVSLTSQRKDPTWNHCKMFRKDNHILLWCVYCGQTYTGMSINKMKQHIAGVGDNVTACRAVGSDVRCLVQANLKENKKKPEVDVRTINESILKKKRKIQEVVGGQPSSVISAIEHFFIDVGVPLEAMKSVYFKPMIDEICKHDPTTVFDNVNGDIVKQMIEDLKEETDNCIRRCGKYGISLLVEEKLEKDKVFLNFSLRFVDGVKHYRTIDVTSRANSLEDIFTIFKEIITSIGEEKILQVVCKNEGIYVDVGMKLEVEFPTVFWTPCAAHVAKLIIEDLEKIQWIRETCDKANLLLNFIFKNDTGINIDGASVNETGFLAVKELKKLEGCLKSLVDTIKWVDSELSRSKEGRDAYERIVDDTFWKNCDSVTVLINLVLKLLMVVSGNEQPALGYALAWMHKTKKEIKNLFDNQQFGDGDYKDFWKIIDKRWGYLQKHRLHIVGFMLNPMYFYGAEKGIQLKMKLAFYDCLEKMKVDVKTRDELVKEIMLYFEPAGVFKMPIAIRHRKDLLHVEWWKAFGFECPNLVSFATNILSQTCSLVQHKPNTNRWTDGIKINADVENQDQSDIEIATLDLGLHKRVFGVSQEQHTS